VGRQFLQTLQILASRCAASRDHGTGLPEVASAALRLPCHHQGVALAFGAPLGLSSEPIRAFMFAKPIRRFILCVCLGAALCACGKKEEPALPEADKAAVEAGGASAKDATDGAHDAAAQGDASGIGKTHGKVRDLLANRRADRALKGERAAVDAEAGAPSADVLPAPVGGGDAGPSAPSTLPELGTRPPSQPRLGTAVPTAPERPAPVTAPPEAVSSLDADRLLPLTAVTEITQAKGLVPSGALPGIAAGPGYSSVFYKAGAAGKFGVSVQAWQDQARRDADDRFRRMRLQYPNAEDVQVMQPAKAFFAHFSTIQMLTFVDSVKRVVATVACGEGVCTHEQLTKLAKAVRDHL